MTIVFIHNILHSFFLFSSKLLFLSSFLLSYLQFHIFPYLHSFLKLFLFLFLSFLLCPSAICNVHLLVFSLKNIFFIFVSFIISIFHIFIYFSFNISFLDQLFGSQLSYIRISLYSSSPFYTVFL